MGVVLVIIECSCVIENAEESFCTGCRGVIPPATLLSSLDESDAEEARERLADCTLAHSERGL